MAASLAIARLGYKVCLVEKEKELGGKTYWLDQLNPTHELAEGCDGDVRRCKVVPRIEDIDSQDSIEVLLGTEVTGVSGEAPEFGVRLARNGEEMDLEVKAIVVATGTKDFDPTVLKEYCYGENEDIITSSELVDLLKEKPLELRRPSDDEIPSRVNFVQCVGSRDKHRGNPYCSVICCTFAVSYSRRIKEMHPDTEVYVHYIDLRGPYHGFEGLLDKAHEKGVIFLKGRVGDIVPEDGKLLVRTEEMDSGDLFFIDSDLVVLAVGQELDESDRQMAEMLGIDISQDGFMMGTESLGEDSKDGMFVVGSARGPKGVISSIEDAKSVILDIVEYLNSN
jgi:heterodisulfide reductase subunit A